MIDPVPKTKTLLAACCAAAFGLGATGASAAHLDFKGNFDLVELNDSGVSGGGDVLYDATSQVLTVNVNASGLTPDVQHAQHIHGRFDGDGNPINSMSPTLADDADGDGFIEVIEGVGQYGDVLLSLFNTGTTMFPTANSDGTLNFSATYDLSDSSVFTPSPATGTIYEMADLFPLFLREIVLHGMVVADGAGGGDGEVNGGPGGFIPILPVASAEINEVPLPGAAVFFLTAAGAGIWRFGRKKMSSSASAAS